MMCTLSVVIAHGNKLLYIITQTLIYGIYSTCAK